MSMNTPILSVTCAALVVAAPIAARADAGKPAARPSQPVTSVRPATPVRPTTPMKPATTPQPTTPPRPSTPPKFTTPSLSSKGEPAEWPDAEEAWLAAAEGFWAGDETRWLGDEARWLGDEARWSGNLAREMAETARAMAEGASARAAARAAEAAARAWSDQGGERAAEDLYWQAQDLLDKGRYERAIEQFNRIIEKMAASNRVDAALYWKAYSLDKLGQLSEALTTLTNMEKKFGSSKWLKDAKALELEIRQASGQAISPDAQADEEMKLMALNALMRSDPEHALPAVRSILSGTSSPKVKERALFVLSQSHDARAREMLAGVAKGGGNPDLQLRAIRYLGAMGAAENRQILDDAFRTSTDPAVKRAILRGFMQAGDRARLVAVAKTESSLDLRIEAVRQLGLLRASDDLAELYKSEQSPEVKKKILDALIGSGQSRPLIYITQHEQDPTLRRSAIHELGRVRRADPATTAEAASALKSIYASDTDPEVRKTVIGALAMQQNAKALVDLARAEKNPQLKKEIVSKLSTMKSQEATDYLLELLK